MQKIEKGWVFHVEREEQSKNVGLGNSVGFSGNTNRSFLELGVIWGEELKKECQKCSQESECGGPCRIWTLFCRQ